MVSDPTPRPSIALRDDELRRIADRLGREPTVVERYAFDAQWSEHCSYKSSRHHLKKLPTSGPGVVLGPGEDAGIVELGEHAGERYGIVIAHESHNHPSQVVPFEGAATGIGGIVRDVLCMGAEVIAVADPLRFGLACHPDDPQCHPDDPHCRPDDPHCHPELVEGCAEHTRYVAQGVVDGISAYGNAIGVPNLAGDVYFDKGFDENCLVNVVALGLVKLSDVIHSRAPEGAVGWDVVLVGKATDPSGFGGASFSSVTLDTADEDANKGAVQVPDPFLKNVLMRASYRVFALLREKQVVAGFKDLGAGGIMGCSAEIVAAGGYGAELNLDEVNVAVDGMPPEVIAVGETQERLLWVLPPSITPDVLRIYNEEFTLPEVAYNARAVVVGRVTEEKRYVLRYRGSIVMDVDIDFLTGSIKDELPYCHPPCHPEQQREAPQSKDGFSAREIADLFSRVLAHHDVCSREPLYRRYDGVVRGCTVLPRGSADAGVLAPIPGSRLGVALAVAGSPRYGRIDARYAAEHAVGEAIRRVSAVGARPVALTDCLNFGNPRKPEPYGEFVAAVEGLARAAEEYAVPFVSGNVSLYNEAGDGRAVPASAIVACVGVLDDVAATVTPGFKTAGSALLWIGSREFAVGGSVLAELLGIEGDLPEISYDAERATIAILQDAIERGVVRSCRAITAGGMLTAVARLAFDAMLAGRAIGAEIDFANPFCETGGFVCEVSDDSGIDLSGALQAGRTIDEAVLVVNGTRFSVADLYEVWSRPLSEVYP